MMVKVGISISGFANIQPTNGGLQSTGTAAIIYGRRVRQNAWAPHIYKITKIENVHGDYINYKYNQDLTTNTPLNLNLTSIERSDGEMVELFYSSHDRVFFTAWCLHLTHVTHNVRIWNYTTSYTGNGNYILTN